jgi:hypothetical protein
MLIFFIHTFNFLAVSDLPSRYTTLEQIAPRAEGEWQVVSRSTKYFVLQGKQEAKKEKERKRM